MKNKNQDSYKLSLLADTLVLDLCLNLYNLRLRSRPLGTFLKSILLGLWHLEQQKACVASRDILKIYFAGIMALEQQKSMRGTISIT